MTIRHLRESDGPAIEAIARLSPEAARWPAKIHAGEAGWAAETEKGVVGFLVARIMADEMEILNLAVDPGERRRGVGGALLHAAIEHGQRCRARRAFLEVRESNRTARRFYERRGFVVFGRRRRYYSNPQEDALLMARGLVNVE
jgi:ribosomal-protein-alanine acetyltransferase